MAYTGFSDEESGTTGPRKFKQDLDGFILQEEESIDREISTYRRRQSELVEIGETDKAKEIEVFIKELLKNSVERQFHRRKMAYDTTGWISKENNFKKEIDDTIRKMKEDG